MGELGEGIGVLGRDRSGRNLWHAVVVSERAGVRQRRRDRRHGADDDGESAALRGLGGGVEARLDAFPVARIVVLVVERRHPVIDEGDGTIEPRRTRLELVEALECDNRCALRAVRPDAPAEGEDRERSAYRSNDPRVLLATDPMGNVDWL